MFPLKPAKDCIDESYKLVTARLALVPGPGSPAFTVPGWPGLQAIRKPLLKARLSTHQPSFAKESTAAIETTRVYPSLVPS